MNTLKLVFVALTLFISLPAKAGGTVGQITALQLESGLIKIDNRDFRITADTVKNDNDKRSSITELKTGQIVIYKNSNDNITSIVVLHQYREVPH
ncbi:MAG: hypothetical protein ACI9OO_000702 [Bacteroidia bacterium]|jgi:hypothetical protein